MEKLKKCLRFSTIAFISFLLITNIYNLILYLSKIGVQLITGKQFAINDILIILGCGAAIVVCAFYLSIINGGKNNLIQRIIIFLFILINMIINIFEIYFVIKNGTIIEEMIGPINYAIIKDIYNEIFYLLFFIIAFTYLWFLINELREKRKLAL